MQALHQSVTRLGQTAINMVAFIGALGLLIGLTFKSSPRMVFKKRGRRLAWRNLWFQLYRV
ncbi:MAG: hypothetical protein ACPGYV_10920, partial [Phycisphaeraceae bacterium]